MNSTVKQEWAEVFDFNYTRTHRISDLTALKDFFLRGLWLSVEEEKVLCYLKNTVFFLITSHVAY